MELISREEVNKILHNQREMQSRVNQLPTYDACYLGSPCEYQNEDIIIPRWRERLSEMRSKDGRSRGMTKEEAIKAIKANYPSGGYERLCEALDMAIKAIEERKEGFWDVYTDCEGKRTYYTCPFCKNKTNHFMYEPKYCDKCGARLKIEGSEEDAEKL